MGKTNKISVGESHKSHIKGENVLWFLKNISCHCLFIEPLNLPLTKKSRVHHNHPPNSKCSCQNCEHRSFVVRQGGPVVPDPVIKWGKKNTYKFISRVATAVTSHPFIRPFIGATCHSTCNDRLGAKGPASREGYRRPSSNKGPPHFGGSSVGDSSHDPSMGRKGIFIYQYEMVHFDGKCRKIYPTWMA